MNWSQWSRGYRLIALIVIYAVVCFLILETGARFLLYVEWRREIRSSHGLHIVESVLGYRLAPGRRAWGATVNDLGYRGPSFPLDKPKGTFRIVCVGNSITFGEAASCDSTTYPAVLGQRIRERGEIPEPVEVINAGVLGYTSHQSLLELKTRLIALRPDLVIFCTGWNDMTFSKYIGWTRDMTWEDPWHFETLSGSYAIWLLDESLLHVPFSVKPAPLQAFADNLEKVVSLCQENDIALAFLDPPTIYSRNMTPSEEKKCRINYFVRGEIPIYQAYMSTMKETAQRRNIRVFDSGLTYAVSGKDNLIVDVCHPNDAGYRYMIGVLYPQVIDEVRKEIARAKHPDNVILNDHQREGAPVSSTRVLAGNL